MIIITITINIIKLPRFPRAALLLLAMLILATVSPPLAAAPDDPPAPALRYAPSAPGHTLPNLGTGAGIASRPNQLFLRKNTAANLGNCAPADLVLAGGTGPFRRGRAIDFSANEANGGKVTHLASIPRGDLGGLDACTLTLWYKLSGPLPKGAYTTLVRGSCMELVFVGDELRVLTHGTIQAEGVPNRMTAPRTPALSRENQWVFVALSWDGGTGGVTLYYGDEAVRATVLKSATLADRGKSAKGGVVNFGYHNLSDGGTRAFDGMMADIRFYSTTLTPTQVEAVRASAGQ
jgi:hypothetical protein